jgi:hypothetical protein
LNRSSRAIVTGQSAFSSTSLGESGNGWLPTSVPRSVPCNPMAFKGLLVAGRVQHPRHRRAGSLDTHGRDRHIRVAHQIGQRETRRSRPRPTDWRSHAARRTASCGPPLPAALPRSAGTRFSQPGLASLALTKREGASSARDPCAGGSRTLVQVTALNAALGDLDRVL